MIPAIDGAGLADYAKQLGEDGLVPEQVRQFDKSKAGTLFATDPPGGTKAKAGDKVKLLVSAGFPRLAFDDEKNVRLIDGATGKPFDPVAKGPSRDKDPTWSPDASRIAYVAGGRVTLKDMTKPDEPAKTLTGDDEDFANLAWAPTADVNLLAMSRRVSDTDADLCFGQITGDGMEPIQCIPEPKFQVTRSIHWTKGGKEILAFGVVAPGEFGMFRWRSKKAFSPDRDDWGKGKLVTDTSKGGEGVLDAEVSPDGKQLALVSNQGGGPFSLFLTKAGDTLMTNAKETGVRACKVVWRSDGKELVVVQADEALR